MFSISYTAQLQSSAVASHAEEDQGEDVTARVTNGMVLALGGGAVSPETRPTTTTTHHASSHTVAADGVDVVGGMGWKSGGGVELVRRSTLGWVGRSESAGGTTDEDDKNVINCWRQELCGAEVGGGWGNLRDFRF